MNIKMNKEVALQLECKRSFRIDFWYLLQMETIAQ